MELSSFKINKWEVGPAKMTADILHAGFNIFLILFLKKRMQLDWEKQKNRSKRTQIPYIKMSHNRLMMAVKIREKSNLSGTSFFNNVETLSARKILFM